MTVTVRGDGIAARCCEHLFSRWGIQAAVERERRSPVPSLMLGGPALQLIRDVFENQDLFRGAPKIRFRVVAWNRDAEPAVLPHSAVVVSEAELLERLAMEPLVGDHPESGWTIYAARPLPCDSVDHAFGTRVAAAARVKLRPSSSPETCWIEAVERGWLFLVPESRESGWLLSVGGIADSLLADSRLVAGQIEPDWVGGKEFPAYPRIAFPLNGNRWLACGSAAMAFDPICGDGTAHAVREGILASAVVQAVARGGHAENLGRHYEARLLAGFHRHLELCREFYQAGYGGAWWQSELAEIDRGLKWCTNQLEAHGPFRYRLNGFQLEPLL